MPTNLDVDTPQLDRVRAMPIAFAAPARTIATYDDYRRALAAVAHLEDQDAASGLHIALVRFAPAKVRPKTSILHAGRDAGMRAFVASVAVIALAATVGAISVRSVLGVALAAAAACGLVGIVLGLRRGAANGLPMTRSDVVPTAYEVRCNADDPDAERAAHRLAKWWLTGLDDGPVTPDRRRVVETGAAGASSA